MSTEHPQMRVRITRPAEAAAAAAAPPTEVRFDCDEGIVDLVVACQLLDLPTVMSCQGMRVRDVAWPEVWLVFASDEVTETFVGLAFPGVERARVRQGAFTGIKFPAADLDEVRRRLDVPGLLARSAGEFAWRPKTIADEAAEAAIELRRAQPILDELAERSTALEDWLHDDRFGRTIELERHLRGHGLLRLLDEIEQHLGDLNVVVEELQEGIGSRLGELDARLPV